MSVFQSQQEHS